MSTYPPPPAPIDIQVIRRNDNPLNDHTTSSSAPNYGLLGDNSEQPGPGMPAPGTPYISERPPVVPGTLDDEKIKKFKETAWLPGQPYRTKGPGDGDGKHWLNFLNRAKEYDTDMCNVWKAEIENLLLFAGLYSAVVTAFLVQTYPTLQENPADRTAALLEQLVLGLHNASAVPQPPPQFTPSPDAIRINILWFVSLIMALGTVVLCILCLQWVREYQRHDPAAPGDPQKALAKRQIHYQGLVAWRVPELISLLPILLIASLGLFAAGLVILLQSLHPVVALAATITVGVFSAIFVITTLGPSLHLLPIPIITDKVPECPWKSPQSWIAHSAVCVITLGSGIPLYLFYYLLKAIVSTKNKVPSLVFNSLHSLERITHRVFSVPQTRLTKGLTWAKLSTLQHPPPGPPEFKKRFWGEITGEALNWVVTHISTNEGLDPRIALYRSIDDVKLTFDHTQILDSDITRAFSQRQQHQAFLSARRGQLEVVPADGLRLWREDVSLCWLLSMEHAGPKDPEMEARLKETFLRNLNGGLLGEIEAARSGTRQSQPHPRFLKRFSHLPIYFEFDDLQSVNQFIRFLDILLDLSPAAFLEVGRGELCVPHSVYRALVLLMAPFLRDGRPGHWSNAGDEQSVDVEEALLVVRQLVDVVERALRKPQTAEYADLAEGWDITSLRRKVQTLKAKLQSREKPPNDD